MSTKAPPDFRQGVRLPDGYLSKVFEPRGILFRLLRGDHIAGMMARYGFKSAERLKTGLIEAAVAWIYSKYDPAEQIYHRSELLLAIANRAEELTNVLEGAYSLLRVQIQEKARQCDKTLDLDQLRKQLVTLREISAESLAELDGALKNGRNAKPFLEKVRALYVQETGRTDRYTRNHYASSHTGDFLSFLIECWTLVGVTKNEKSAAADIDRYL